VAAVASTSNAACESEKQGKEHHVRTSHSF
jgi:hypothetical protein